MGLGEESRTTESNEVVNQAHRGVNSSVGLYSYMLGYFQ